MTTLATTVPAPPAVGYVDPALPDYQVAAVCDMRSADALSKFTWGAYHGPQGGGGYSLPSHVSTGADGLVIVAQADAAGGGFKGLVGGGTMFSHSIVAPGGGVDVCAAMTPGPAAVHGVMLRWPTDNQWGEGEDDLREGSASNASFFLHRLGTNPQQNADSGEVPNNLADGAAHTTGLRYNVDSGFDLYSDGAIYHTFADLSAVPTMPGQLAVQLQDTATSTGSVTLQVYWVAFWGYAKAGFPVAPPVVPASTPLGLTFTPPLPAGTTVTVSLPEGVTLA